MTKASIQEQAPLLDSHNHVAHGTVFTSFLGLMGTMAGAGALALPSTMLEAHPVPSIVILLAMAMVAYAACQCCCLAADASGEYTFEGMSAKLFGPWRQLFVRVLTLVLLFGVCAMFMVIGMDLLSPFVDSLISRTTVGIVFTAIAIPLSVPETVHALRFSNSLVVGCLLYIVVVVFYRTIQQGGWPDSRNSTSLFTTTFHGLSYSIPIQALSFGCQINAVRVYGELIHKEKMKTVNVLLMGNGFVMYAVFSLLGYMCFKGFPPADILTGFAKDDFLVNGARLVLGVCMLLKIPLVFQPFRQVLEVITIGSYNSTLHTRILFTFVSLTSAFLLAVSSKDLSWVMGFVGSTGDILINFTIPGLFLWEVGNRQLDPTQSKQTKLYASIMVGIGVTLCLISLIGLF